MIEKEREKRKSQLKITGCFRIRVSLDKYLRSEHKYLEVYVKREANIFKY